MRIRSRLLLLASALAVALVRFASPGEAGPPTVLSVLQVRDAKSGRPDLLLAGRNLTSVKGWSLLHASTSADAGTVTEISRSKTQVVLGLPAALDFTVTTAFKLVLSHGHASTEVPVTVVEATPPAAPFSTNDAVFTANGTFTVPPGISWITVEAWGGGGGGGPSSPLSNGGGGGGGGGAYGRQTFAVSPGTPIPVTIGTGGIPGGAGGTTLVGNLLTASGGQPGLAAGAGGGGGGGIGGTSGATINITGGTGGSGGAGNGGATPSAMAGGSGGDAARGGPGGSGGLGAYALGTPGGPGNSPGGGGAGGGAALAAPGGGGAAGCVIIRY